MKKEKLDTNDFDISDEGKQEARNHIAELRELYEKQKDSIEELRQIMHNRGLDVGLPSVIVFDINQIASSLNDMRGLLMSENLRQKWRDKDNDITKVLNRGDAILAHHERMMQVIELRESIGKLDSFLFDLVNRLSRLQQRMVGKEIHDYAK